MALIHRLLLLPSLVVAALVAKPAPGQGLLRFASPRKVHLMQRDASAEGMRQFGLSATIAVGDVDNDGTPDLITSGGSSFEAVRLNDGASRFVDGKLGYLTSNAGAAARVIRLADVDRDGRLDVFIGGMPSLLHAGANRLFLNGTSYREVTATHLPADTDTTVAAAFVDLDRDGDVDLVTINGSTVAQQDRVYLNNGNGVFTDATASSLPAALDMTTCVAAGDLDGDGDPDLIVGAAANVAAKLLQNDGRGKFTLMPFPHLMAEHVNDLELVDVDRDGDLDVVAAAGSVLASAAPKQSRLLLNDGRAGFTDQTVARLPGVSGDGYGVAVGDIDRDGDPDLLFNISLAAVLLRNDGRGTFSDVSATLLPSDRKLVGSSANFLPDPIVLVDVDRDGDLDVVAIETLLLNNGRGTFVNASTRPTVSATPSHIDVVNGFGSLLIDVDGDTNLDVITTGYNRLTNALGALWLGDGRGGFRDVSAVQLPATGTGWRVPAAADIDRDGDLDLAFGGQGAPVLLQNNGGFFADNSATLPAVGGNVRGVTFADLDRDGDDDMILSIAPSGAQTGQNRLLRNNGAGTFFDATPAWAPSDADASNACVAADVDKDGDLDLVFANGQDVPPSGAQNRLYLNLGGGRFADATTTHLPIERYVSFGIVAGDFDRDGDIDFVTNDSSLLHPGQVRLYLNDGKGVFRESSAGRIPQGSYAAGGLLAADFDEDGDLDLYVAAGPSGADVLWNDGTARFMALRSVDTTLFAACAGDIDGDGDLDLISGTDILVNRHRQLHTPFVAQAGQPFVVDLYGKPGYAQGTDVALPLLDFALLPSPLVVPPIGRLWLAPATMLFGPGQLLPTGSGKASMRFTVPAIPTLIGRTMVWQGLILEGGTALRLTNVRDDVLGY